jgi:hypothetical protein
VESASYALFADTAKSASHAVTANTASYAVRFNVSQSLTASGLRYPTADNGEESFMQTNGAGTLSLQYVKTIYEEIYNGEVTTITKGTPVYVSGSVGASSVVYRADAGNPSKMPVVYVVADNVAPASTGRGIALGLIKGVNTTGYPAGTEIYLAVALGFAAINERIFADLVFFLLLSIFSSLIMVTRCDWTPATTSKVGLGVPYITLYGCLKLTNI